MKRMLLAAAAWAALSMTLTACGHRTTLTLPPTAASANAKVKPPPAEAVEAERP